MNQFEKHICSALDIEDIEERDSVLRHLIKNINDLSLSERVRNIINTSDPITQKHFLTELKYLLDNFKVFERINRYNLLEFDPIRLSQEMTAMSS